MNTAINDSSEMDAESELDDEYMEYDYFQDWSNNRIITMQQFFHKKILKLSGWNTVGQKIN